MRAALPLLAALPCARGACPASAPPPPCCRALNAQCMSCASCETVEEYCRTHRSTQGCQHDLSTLTHGAYMREFGKAYGDDERARRARVFADNVAAIRAHNADSSQTWYMAVNQFTDWTDAEFKKWRKGTVRPPRAAPRRVAETPQLKDPRDLPVSVDWRTKDGVVTPVKDQGSCGSCWAFSAVETLESHLAIATGEAAPVLSEQQVVSCSPNPDHCGGMGGCLGSTQPLAFNYTLTTGITTEADYPYKGMLGFGCHKDKITPVASNDGYVEIPNNNYTALINAVATLGPVAISAAADWKAYGGGVFDSADCGYDMDHGIQLVGYGTDAGTDYWLVRNSWAESFGESGYIRIKRFGEGKEPCGMDNTPGDGDACKGDKTPVQYCGLCAIMSSSSYPTGVHKV